jgi:hypothetical protein
MTEQKQTELEVLVDTINYYKYTNRAVTGEPTGIVKCTYLNPVTGYKCAIGRLLTNDECKWLLKHGIGMIDDFFESPPCDDPEYISIMQKLSKYSNKFLYWLQRLHDNEEYWSENGLSDTGKLEVEYFKSKYFNENTPLEAFQNAIKQYNGMGQHTQCYKSKTRYDELQLMYNTLDKVDSWDIYMDTAEKYALEATIDRLYDEAQDDDYYDVFRTNKREPDGTYTEDVIYGKAQCDKWLIDNKDLVYYIDQDRLDKFWDEYPDGVITFG